MQNLINEIVIKYNLSCTVKSEIETLVDWAILKGKTDKGILIAISVLIFASCVEHHKEIKRKFKFKKVKSNYIYNKSDNNKTNYLEKEDSLNLVNS